MATLAVSDIWADESDALMSAMGVVADSLDGWEMPVRAVQISATGGSLSVQGTVKRGLSHRLWVLGSSYRKIRFSRRAGG